MSNTNTPKPDVERRCAGCGKWILAETKLCIACELLGPPKPRN